MPGGHKAIRGSDNTNGFQKNPQNIRNKPKKIYTILKEKGYSSMDIKTAFGEMAWYTLAELKEVHEDEKQPVITRIVANQFYAALKKADWTKIKEILDHVVGKPLQTIETTETIKSITLKDV